MTPARELRKLAEAICAAWKSGRRTPMGVALAIDAVQMLMTPERDAELRELRTYSRRYRLAYMSARRRAFSITTRVDGPTPMLVRQTPSGVVLDHSAGLTPMVVADVLELLLKSDDTSWWDRLQQLANTEPDDRPVDERPACEFEQLVADMAEHCSSRVPLYGRKRLHDVARRLRALAYTLPAQQNRRAA